MKILLIADIHGNLPALEAILRHANEDTPIDKILNMGDSVGYGPFPNEVVQVIQGTSFANILGNYDKKVLSKSHRQEGWARVSTPDKRQLFAWTYQALSKKSRNYLKSLPKSRELILAGKSILMTHGSPASHTEHLLPDTPPERFAELAETAGTDIVLCGHSHQAFVHEAGETLFVNPGSAGRPDDGNPLASYAILTIEGDSVEAVFHRVPYDIMAAVRRMRQTGLPLIFTDILRQGLNYDDTAARMGHARQADAPDPSGIITLMADSSLSVYAASVVKGEMLRIAPQAQLMDIQTSDSRQSFLSYSHLLAESARYYPAGSVHLALVDSASNPQPRLLAARVNSHYFISPDNGLLTALLKQAAWCSEYLEIVALDNPEYTLLKPTNVALLWGGMCSAAAHLTNGVPLRTLGTPISDPLLTDLPQPIRTANGWEAEVVWVNLAGTLHTNLSAELLPENHQDLEITISGHTINGITDNLSPADEGKLTAFINDRGELAIMSILGSADDLLPAEPGTKLIIKIQ